MDEPSCSPKAASQPRGGPQSPEGKANSRANALRHGLTAKTLLPQVLTQELVQDCFEQLQAEWRPQTPTQQHLVREMARHQAALERTEQIEVAALRRSAIGALGLELDVLGDLDRVDVALAGAGTADAIDRVSRYRRSHERAYLRSMAALRDLQALAAAPAPKARVLAHDGAIQVSGPRFDHDSQCESYLLSRWTSGEAGCPGCTGTTGSWLDSRKVWQCAACRHQSSLRTGTIMAGSRLSLLIWFQAIGVVLKNPSASTADIQTATGLTRACTARNLAKRIREAMQSEHRATQLAGLDRVIPSGAQLSQVSV